MDDRLKRLEKLKRLGVKQGTRHIVIPPPKPQTEYIPPVEAPPLHFLLYQDDLQHAAPIEAVIAGQEIANERGRYFNFEARYPLASAYGRQPLAALLAVPMETVAAITGDDRWLDLLWRDVLFIDTETTGLEIAAGVVAFLIGVGYLDGPDFVVRQVFMRDFDEETALLHDLRALFARFKAVASFNGKTFDLPLLENRFVLARLLTDLFDAPHFDLLHPARRLWHRRLENCKLGTLEKEILGVTRTQADVPGYFIPSLYRKYLVDHDARPMAGIFYHNEMDVVSMAALAAVLGQYFAFAETDEPPELDPVEWLGLGLWRRQLGHFDPAENALNRALAQSLTPELRQLALKNLAAHLKQNARSAEAESLWQELAATPDSLLALEELAKYYEWQTGDFGRALTCIDYALQTLRAQGESWQKQEALAAWEHRRARVDKKQEKSAG